jgi:hypothetical protein
LRAIIASGFMLGLWVSLGGCTHLPAAHSLDIQPGDRLVINQPISFAPGTTRTFIQYGRFTTRQHFERYDPHCRLEKKQLSERVTILAPDRFKIARLGIDQEEVAQLNPPLLLASLGKVRLAMGGDDFPPPTMDLIHLYLKGEQTDPALLRLTCAGALSDGSPADYPRNLRPDRAKINRILGQIGQIVSASSPNH